MPGLRTRFVRDLVEAFERDGRAEGVAEALRRLEPRMSTPDLRATLRSAAHADTLDVSDAEELLLGLDAGVSDGTGLLLEKLATDQFARLLAQGALSISGDLMATVARMKAPLEHLFVGLPVGFELAKKRDGFVLFLGVGGRPRTARLLRHLAVGAIRAAQRFAREGMSEDVSLVTESMGDRARVEARLGTTAPASAGTPAPPTRQRGNLVGRRPSQPHLPTTKPTLEAIDRIIRRTTITPPRLDVAVSDEIVAPRSRRAPVEPPPASAPPRSDTLPSLSQSGFVTTRDDDDEPSSSSG